MTPTAPQQLADLAQAFSRQAVTAETLRVYLRELEDVDAVALDAAVRALIRKSEYFPTVRAIREEVAEQALALPDEAGALAQVDGLAAWARQDDDERGHPPTLNPVVRAALDAAGGTSAFREATASVVRGQFARIYRDLRARAVLDVIVNGSPLLLPPGK